MNGDDAGTTAADALDPRTAVRDGEVGPIGEVPAAQVVRATGLVRTGRMISLSAVRFPGMPLFPGHPPFQVTTYRSPRGLANTGATPWGPRNDIGLGYMAEVISGTAHSGAHVDGLAHMTVGDEGRWFGGGRADRHLGDFGPLFGDGAKLPPMVSRGVLLDIAGHRGVGCLPAGEPVDADELEQVAHDQGVEVGRFDIVCIRTGYMGLWPDAEAMAAHRTPGPDLSAALWLAERGVVATGTDTETYEVQPTNHPGEPYNPQPVHVALLIERGILLMESLDLEALARAGVDEFCFVALPLKIAGATGSMIDPVALL